MNQADIWEKEKNFLLYEAVLPLELFGTSIETVVGKFRKAKAHSRDFKTFIPCQSRLVPRASKGSDLSRSEDHRQDQVSTASHPTPSLWGREWRRCEAKRRKKDLREVIQSKSAQHSRVPEAK